jgi:hypothetical protein
MLTPVILSCVRWAKHSALEYLLLSAGTHYVLSFYWARGWSCLCTVVLVCYFKHGTKGTVQIVNDSRRITFCSWPGGCPGKSRSRIYRSVYSLHNKRSDFSMGRLQFVAVFLVIIKLLKKLMLWICRLIRVCHREKQQDISERNSELGKSNGSSSRCQWLRAVRRGSSAFRLVGLRVRIPSGAWMFVSCECCVLSGRCLCVGLVTRSEEFFRVWCVYISVIVKPRERGKPWNEKGSKNVTWGGVTSDMLRPTFS